MYVFAWNKALERSILTKKQQLHSEIKNILYPLYNVFKVNQNKYIEK